MEKQANIAVLLNVFKRGEVFEKQLRAVQHQSVKPVAIYVWKNAGDDIPNHLKDEVIIADCNNNLGVWARLAFALNIDAEYICMFDDDTVPGLRWLENCSNTIKTHNGLLGTRGLRFLSKRRYGIYTCFGWTDPNEKVEQVDIVGHAWFFRRDWLAAFWNELPERGFDKLVGEDIHFSYAIQKHLKLNTYVPPHPIDQKDMWGSISEVGMVSGVSPDAVSMRPDAAERFNKVYLNYIKKGFKLSAPDEKHIVLTTGLIENSFIKNYLMKFPALFKMTKAVRAFLKSLNIHI
jgi:hypothetical protein